MSNKKSNKKENHEAVLSAAEPLAKIYKEAHQKANQQHKKKKQETQPVETLLTSEAEQKIEVVGSFDSILSRAWTSCPRTKR